jgi:hypothetical protein
VLLFIKFTSLIAKFSILCGSCWRVLAIKACLQMQWVPIMAGFFYFTNVMNPVQQPRISRAVSAQTLTSFSQERLFSWKSQKLFPKCQKPLIWSPALPRKSFLLTQLHYTQIDNTWTDSFEQYQWYHCAEFKKNGFQYQAQYLLQWTRCELSLGLQWVVTASVTLSWGWPHSDKKLWYYSASYISSIEIWWQKYFWLVCQFLVVCVQILLRWQGLMALLRTAWHRMHWGRCISSPPPPSGDGEAKLHTFFMIQPFHSSDISTEIKKYH